MRTDYKITSYALSIGTLIVSSRRKLIRKSVSGDLPTEELTTRVSFIPTKQQRVQQMFRITSHQSYGHSSVVSSFPMLNVNRVLPASAPVFSIVKEGRLHEFKELLRSNRASIRDHDEYGASLLHVSLSAAGFVRACLTYRGVRLRTTGRVPVSH